MANYKKLSEYSVDETPSDGDLIPSIVDNGNGTYTNVLIPYALLKGAPGADGVGIPAGGTTAQVLAKASGDNYNTQWVTITVNKAAVGLANVDNTSDVNKPVSTATQTAIDTVQMSLDASILYGLDGFHANATPTANSIPVLDSNAKLPLTAVPGYAFKARRATNLSSPGGGGADIVFDSEFYDIGNWYNNSTGLATAPVNGVYHFEASAFTETTTTGRTFFTTRGTALSTKERGMDTDSSYVRRSKGTFEIYMTAGSTFGVNLYTSAANQLNHQDTWLSGYLVVAG